LSSSIITSSNNTTSTAGRPASCCVHGQANAFLLL
jgi:hypothetical protein